MKLGYLFDAAVFQARGDIALITVGAAKAKAVLLVELDLICLSAASLLGKEVFVIIWECNDVGRVPESSWRFPDGCRTLAVGHG